MGIDKIYFNCNLKMYTIFVFSLFSLINFSSSNNLNNDPDSGYFWHVTDIHVDQNYSRTGNPKKLCHEDGGYYSDNGLYGNFLCDSPQILVNITFQSMKDIEPNPDFIIWTGDNLPHTRTFDIDWNVIYDALYNISIIISNYFPNAPIFPCIGNHDTFPPNMLLPDKTNNSVYQEILTKGGWNKFLNEEAKTSFLKGGFYSQVVKPGIRIISLNTILWYSPNPFTKKMLDPADQFKWFEEILENSRKSSEKVYIIGHVPPGFYNRVERGKKSLPTFHPQFLDSYLKILKKYYKIISSQMFGHLHMDMFQLFQLNSGDYLSSSLLASSVTPWHFESISNTSLPVNPSIRLFRYNLKNGILKDYDQYFLNLTKENNRNSSKVNNNLYEKLYSFSEAYEVNDLSTESLSSVFDKIKNNYTLFNKFFKFSTAGKESVLCDEFCKTAQLCSISSTSIDEYNSCMKDSSESEFKCHSLHFNNESYSNFLVYGIAIFILLIILFLLYFIYRHKSNEGDMYIKLQREF